MRWQPASPLLSGLVLGLFGTAKLLTALAPLLGLLVNGLAGLLWLFMGVHFLIFYGHYTRGCQSPAVLSSLATYPMASLLLAQALQPIFPGLAVVVWWLAVLAHGALLGYFSWQYLRPGWSHQVLPSWTVLYVGVAMVGLTASVPGVRWLGDVTVGFGLVAAVILYPALIRRLRTNPLPTALAPQVAILTAPLSLLLAAMLALEWPLASGWLLAFWGLSQGFYLVVISRLPRLLCQPFAPTYSALTFPLVITALATRQLNSRLGLGWDSLVQLEMILALLVVTSVSLAFLGLACKSVRQQKKRD